MRWLNRGFRSIEGIESSEAAAWRARMRSYLAGIRNGQARWTEAVATCREAIAEAEAVGELSALARACYLLDWALVELGRPDEATHSWRAVEIYERLGDREHEGRVLNNLGGLAYWGGRWDEAVELYQRAAACAQRAGRPADAAFTDGNIGEILSDQGHLDDAEEHLQSARRVFRATGDLSYSAYADALLARLTVRRGEYAEGLAMLESAMADLRRFGLEDYAELAQAWIAEAEALGGDAMRAMEVASERMRTNDRERPLLTRMAGIALARLGERKAAMRELEHALRTARDRGAEYDIAATIDVMAAIDGADPTLLRERDEILKRLKIERLPAPVLGPTAA